MPTQSKTNACVSAILTNHFQFQENVEEELEQTQPQNLAAQLCPEKPKTVANTMRKSLSMVRMKTKETTEELTNGIIKRTKSLKSLRSKRKLSNDENQENIKGTTETSEKKPKIEKKKIDESEQKSDTQSVSSLSLSEQTLSKFAGVKNIITNAVWGVPYAKVVEDLDISVNEPELENESTKSEGNCVIS